MLFLAPQVRFTATSHRVSRSAIEARTDPCKIYRNAPYADAPALLDEQARVPGLAPWLQEAPLAAQVHARYLRDVRRQLTLVSDERDFRIDHEVPALRAGRRTVLANLQRAHLAAEAAHDRGRACVMQHAIRRTQRLIAHDERTLERLDAAAAVPARHAADGLEAGMGSDEDWASEAGSNGGTLELQELEPDMRSALRQRAEEEEAAAAAPFEPVRQEHGDFLGTAVEQSAGSTDPLPVRQPGPDALNGACGESPCSVELIANSAEHTSAVIQEQRTGVSQASVVLTQGAIACADLVTNSDIRELQLVETLAEASAPENRCVELVILTEQSMTAKLTGEDFRSVTRNELLTTPIVDFVSVMLQARCCPFYNDLALP